LDTAFLIALIALARLIISTSLPSSGPRELVRRLDDKQKRYPSELKKADKGYGPVTGSLPGSSGS
jgi:hypothetical protein